MIEVALAVVASVALIVALGALYLLGRFSIAQGRFDVDAQQRAVNLQRYIDTQVERRLTYAPVAVRSAVPNGELPAQPVDPRAKQTGRVDDVHEAEREEARMRGEDYEETVRDTFAPQPPMIET